MSEPTLNEVIQHCAPQGRAVAYKIFARGVQVYQWNGTAWAPAGPLADLYALDPHDAPLPDKIGTHSMHLKTPAWEFAAGRVIVDKPEVIPGAGPQDIDWLRVQLRDDAENRQGLNYSHLLRVRTRLGKAPDKDTQPGEYVGQRCGVGYESYYVFLR